jgi:hypothetical protein
MGTLDRTMEMRPPIRLAMIKFFVFISVSFFINHRSDEK